MLVNDKEENGCLCKIIPYVEISVKLVSCVMCSQLNILSTSVLILLLIFKLLQCSFNTIFIVLDELSFTSFNISSLHFWTQAYCYQLFLFTERLRERGHRKPIELFTLFFNRLFF